MTPPQKDAVYVGLDAGGSKTKLLARLDEQPDVSLSGPAANVQRVGPDAVADVFAKLIEAAAAQLSAPAAPLVVCAGVSGAGNAEDRAAITERLEARLGTAPARPAATVHVTHDAEIALEAAFEGESGVIVIAGTGSVVFGRTADGRALRVGGWGYLLGDEGSGHTLGARGLRAALAAADGGPATQLGALLAQHHGLDSHAAIIRQIYQHHWPAQQAAPLVIEAARTGDDVARQILARQTRLLAEQVGWLFARAQASVTPQIALLGGLIQERPYFDALRSALRQQLPHSRLRAPAHAPVVGALRLALQTTPPGNG